MTQKPADKTAAKEAATRASCPEGFMHASPGKLSSYVNATRPITPQSQVVVGLTAVPMAGKPPCPSCGTVVDFIKVLKALDADATDQGFPPASEATGKGKSIKTLDLDQ